MNKLVKDTIITERIILRKPKMEDAIFVFNNWASDPEVAKYVTWNAHKTIEESKAIVAYWLEQEKDPNTIRFMITLKETGEPIGAIDVVGYIDDVPEVGYCLSRKYWNKGIMTEICSEFVRYLFSLGYKKVLIEADERNIGSNRVIEKCGFNFIYKEHKEHASAFKSEPITVNWYEISK